MEEKQEIKVQKINLHTINVKVGSIDGSTLISHRLSSEQVAETITNREIGKTSKKKLRDFNKEYESCFHYTTDKKYGYPAMGFMNAILNACIPLGIPKTQIKRSVRLLGDIYELKYKKLNKRIDSPRRSGMNAAPDTRYRPEFVDWECTLVVQYDSNLISPDQIINLVNQAGFSSGVGDWRPSSPKSSGTHGMFKVLQTK
jgi:hypothetical protein